MKKILTLLLITFILFGCAPKKEEYYNLTFENVKVAVGYDSVDVIDDLHVNSFNYHLDKKENKILDDLEIYVNDLNDNNIYIDDYKLGTSIKNTCTDLNGEIVSNNGNACVLHKTVGDFENVIIIYGNILNDDVDKIDRIEVKYLYEEDN